MRSLKSLIIWQISPAKGSRPEFMMIAVQSELASYLAILLILEPGPVTVLA